MTGGDHAGEVLVPGPDACWCGTPACRSGWEWQPAPAPGTGRRAARARPGAGDRAMTAAQQGREAAWPAVAAPIATVAPWRPAAASAQPDPHAADWAGPGFSHPGPTEDAEARQLADAEAWAGRLPPPEYGHAEWLAEGLRARARGGLSP